MKKNTSLEQIISDVNLYAESRASLPMEDVVEMMRRNILIEPSKQGDIFRITFTGSDPKQVARVTNALAARFIEENIKYREERASETSAYTKDELEMAKEMLDRKEAVMRDYKLQHYNEMPDQRPTNMGRLISLQEQYQNRQESIQDLERSRILLQDQISVRREILEENAKLRETLDPEEPLKITPESDETLLAQLQFQLEMLQAKYTDKHPSIRQVKRQIKVIEKRLADKSHDGGGDGPGYEPEAGKSRFRVYGRSTVCGGQRDARRTINRPSDTPGTGRPDAGTLGYTWRPSNNRHRSIVPSGSLHGNDSGVQPGRTVPYAGYPAA